MTSLVDCPQCHTRVLPMAGRLCPACRRNVDSTPPPPTPEQVVEAVYGFAAERMLEGTDPSEIQSSLTRGGLDAEAAATVVGNLKQIKAKAHKEAGRKNMLYGALWCIAGIGLTALTYRMASAAGGGKFLVAWGAILFGGIQFVRGLMLSAAE